MVAEQIRRVLEDKVLVHVEDGVVSLRKPHVMDVRLQDVPAGATVIDMQQIGPFLGVKSGRWKQKCDYLVLWSAEGSDRAMFVELRKSLSNDGRAEEQLRRSLPYLKYLCSLCHLEYGPRARRVRARYVVIGKTRHPNLGKPHLAWQSLAAKNHRGIVVARFVGTLLRFAWLEREPVK